MLAHYSTLTIGSHLESANMCMMIRLSGHIQIPNALKCGFQRLEISYLSFSSIKCADIAAF